ncbi:adenylate kinase family enzyme [Microbacterium sp. AK009]|uniref:AAA family ATPase n=1 Tax=Microbacterium sp. AK009 TaxID=2723068 RepID=UPI0015CB498D|nr:AAA family ATPase [Microbacterium sp. AK009]NYF15994.1 adenylate kinase family enzyme [Microbacterium sp. AK009]
MRLEDLGGRICVLGPSGSGKSTLANAIGELRALPVVHLDRYRHIAGTQWQIRADDEFTCLHDAAVRSERWVMDGNYSRLLPHRLARATGVILLDISTAASLVRYVRRTLGSGPRIGGLEGTREKLSWEMVSYIIKHTRPNRQRRKELFQQLTLPKIYLRGTSAVTDFYRIEGLPRPQGK